MVVFWRQGWRLQVASIHAPGTVDNELLRLVHLQSESLPSRYVAATDQQKIFQSCSVDQPRLFICGRLGRGVALPPRDLQHHVLVG
jgi:hypothetical protein